RDSIDPGRELRLAAEAGEAAVHSEKDVLTGVLALGVAHAEGAQESEDQGGVTLVERAPGAAIAGATSRHELTVRDPVRVSGEPTESRGIHAANLVSTMT